MMRLSNISQIGVSKEENGETVASSLMTVIGNLRA